MLMKMLEAGGMDLVEDGQRTADEDNPKGYYEDERVKDLVKEKDKAWLGEARGKPIKVISYLLKELPENHNYKVLLLRRNLKEVLASQAKMLERRGEPSEASDERMLELLESDLWKASYLLKRAARFQALELRYREVLENPAAQAQRVNDFLGGSLDVRAMAEVVDPKLYRNRVEGLAGDG